MSNVAEHLIKNRHNNQHRKEFANFRGNNNKHTLEYLEKYYIYKHKNKNKIMNIQTEYKNDELYKLLL